MAEKSSSLDDDETSCKQFVIPSNEEIINELTKDLCSSSIGAAEETNSIRDKHDERKQEKEDISVDSFEEDITKVSGGDSDKSENEEDHVKVEDDFIDEEALKDFEMMYSAEDKERLRKEAETLKSKGNEQFKAGNYRDSAQSYTFALRTCPLAFDKDRAVLYSNRAATKVKLGLKPSAIEDCSKAIELNPAYLKAYFRRAQLYEEVEKLDEALADYKKVLELDPLHREALYTSRRLAEQIHERNEKMKTEMLGKLKDLGNMILRPFGLSTDNFQVTQDPNSGGYSINFQQMPQ